MAMAAGVGLSVVDKSGIGFRGSEGGKRLVVGEAGPEVKAGVPGSPL